MPWKHITIVSRHRMAQHGLSSIVAAGLLCRQAERLYPNLFVAVSVRQRVLHLEVEDTSLLALTSIQGPLLQQLNSYAKTQQLPQLERVRLTITKGLAIVSVTV